MDALEKLLYDVHVQMGGSVLTLRYNRRDMERSLKRRPRLVKMVLPARSKSSSARRVREKFLTRKNSLFCLNRSGKALIAAGGYAEVP